jgi:hypothetical protein
MMKVNKYNKNEITSEEENAYVSIQIIEDELNKIQGGFPNNYNGIFDELESIKLLISQIGELVLHEEKETKRKRKEILNKGEEHEVDDVFETTSKTLKFREYTYNSLLFLIHLNFEKYLIQLCKLINSTPLKKDDIINKFPESEFEDVDSFYRFLNEQVSINTEVKDETFPTIRIYKEIRNALYHRDGFTYKENVITWIKMREDILLTNKKTGKVKCKESGKKIIKNVEFQKIKITNSSFLISYINDIESYFKKILVLIRTRYYSAYEQGKL